MNNKLLGKYCDAQEEDEAEYYETLAFLIEEKKIKIAVAKQLNNIHEVSILQEELDNLERIAYE